MSFVIIATIAVFSFNCFIFREFS